MNSSSMKCYWVEKDDLGNVHGKVCVRELDDLPPCAAPSVDVAVQYSSLNYKDALAANGHPGIVRSFPHIPGIDAAGTVLRSDDPRFSLGQPVLVTGHDLGVGHPGAWSQRIRVPAGWVLPLPSGLSALEAMTLGTAGFTAAQCVEVLRQHQVEPSSGEVVVSGATGGVGSVSVKLLSQLGYRVVAVTGKAEQHDRLRSWGASEVVDRTTMLVDDAKPLLKSRFAGGVDTVGGTMLSTILRSIHYRGAVAACGLTGGHELNMTVYPFLLRGITLCGIDSAMCPMQDRILIWEKLADSWKPTGLAEMARIVHLEDMPELIATILAGKVTGRIVIEIDPI